MTILFWIVLAIATWGFLNLLFVIALAAVWAFGADRDSERVRRCQERAVASFLRPRSGLVAVAPINHERRRGGNRTGARHGG